MTRFTGSALINPSPQRHAERGPSGPDHLHVREGTHVPLHAAAPVDPQQPPGAAPYAPAPPQLRGGLGTAALVLGIIGAVSGLIPFFFWLAGILGVIALILGLVGRGRVKRGEAANKGVTTFGAVLGLVALILSIVGAVITFKAVGDAVDEINKAISGTTASKAPAAAKGDKGKADTAEEPKSDDKADPAETLAAGDTSIYDDDLQVTVSAPEDFTPERFAVGHTKGHKAYVVTVVIENAGKEKFDATLATAEARAGKDGVRPSRSSTKGRRRLQRQDPARKEGHGEVRLRRPGGRQDPHGRDQPRHLVRRLPVGADALTPRRPSGEEAASKGGLFSFPGTGSSPGTASSSHGSSHGTARSPGTAWFSRRTA